MCPIIDYDIMSRRSQKTTKEAEEEREKERECVCVCVAGQKGQPPGPPRGAAWADGGQQMDGRSLLITS